MVYLKARKQDHDQEAEDNQIIEYISRLETLNDFFRYLSVVLHLKMPGPHYEVISAEGHDFILFAVKIWNDTHRFLPLNHNDVIGGIKQAWKCDMQRLKDTYAER